ncbi:unnamed protein product [Symbiodinium pilosum]|uniref:Uncharacterized protein n=1 Tax=Symbiodinium pilosum TaxID=2952 RepID=A0A812W2T1_SYMPI|nr:unnamed protein product [Symbiodinium pilosum]
MNPKTTSGFRAILFDWDFYWNWNGVAMSGFWLVLLAVLLAIPSLGLLPWSRESVQRHSCMWSAATELAQLSEDTAGCLEYLMTILQEEAWKFPFHADSSNFYIRQLGNWAIPSRAVYMFGTAEALDPRPQIPVAQIVKPVKHLLVCRNKDNRSELILGDHVNFANTTALTVLKVAVFSTLTKSNMFFVLLKMVQTIHSLAPRHCHKPQTTHSTKPQTPSPNPKPQTVLGASQTKT